MEVLQSFWSFQQDVFALIRSIAPYAYLYLILVNAIAFVLYGLDKSYAKKKKWRIPEANLIGIALLYGAPGAYLGMKVFRHKTKHPKFTITVPCLLILQIVFAIGCICF